MSLVGTLITPNLRDAWLAERATGIGSSEAAVAIGISPYDTPLNLYLRKTGDLGPVEENDLMRWGNRLEPIVAEAYMERIGCRYIADQQFARSEAHPFMLATVDRIRDDGRIVELKTAGARSADGWGPDGTDEVPSHYAVQVYHQMAVLEAEIADVAVLIGGNDFRTYTLTRNEPVITEIIRRETEFWERVQSRTPPTAYVEDLGVMHVLYPETVGELTFDSADTMLVEDWELLGQKISKAQSQRDRIKLRILAQLKEAASVRLADGRTLNRNVVTKSAEKKPRSGYTYSDLRLKKGKS